MVKPLITIAVPSYNQGQFLDQALTSVFQQDIPIEVFVCDGGSTDNSIEIIKKWEHSLAGWHSHADGGQSDAINEGIANGAAPYVCWLNSDDWLLAGGLKKLLSALISQPDVPAVYGQAWNIVEKTAKRYPVWVEGFSERRLALRCIISQPATLIRRTAWEKVGGLDKSLHMVMDYDLWWRIYKQLGSLYFVDDFIAVNRVHDATKTNTLRKQHYSEAMAIVRKHYGRVPMKWWLYQPYSVWYKSLKG